MSTAELVIRADCVEWLQKAIYPKKTTFGNLSVEFTQQPQETNQPSLALHKPFIEPTRIHMSKAVD